MKETSKHLEIFEYYYTLGDDRTIGKVADKFNVSHTTLSKYKKVFNWDDRVRQRDMEIYQQLRNENNEEIKDTLESYRKVIKASVAEYIKNLKNRKIKVDNVKDFKMLVELELKICGFIEQLDDEKASALVNDISINFGFLGADKDDSESE